MTTYLFIEIEIQDGERRHTHKVLHATTGSNIEFAVNRYVASYWGYGELDRTFSTKSVWWWNDICGWAKRYEILTEEEYNILKRFL